MPGELDTAGKYRSIADTLADIAVGWRARAGDDVDSLSFEALATVAAAGKTALEAAAAADLSESEVGALLRGMKDELVASGIIDENELTMLSTLEVLRLVVTMGSRARSLAERVGSYRNAHATLKTHVERLRDQAAAAGDDESAVRAVRRHETALQEAQMHVDRGEQA